MLARIIPGTMDVEGRQVAEPRARHGFRPTFPMGSYLTQPLKVRCRSLDEVRRFLATCRYVSDDKAHGRDYWTPPEVFENSRSGDCDCAAVWTWRQLVDAGIECRFVLGWAGQYGGRHAWIHTKIDGEWYVLEPFAASLGMTIPGLWAIRHRPHVSVCWVGERLKFFEHQETECCLAWPVFGGLVAENALFHMRILGRLVVFVARATWSRVLRKRRQLPIRPNLDSRSAGDLLRPVFEAPVLYVLASSGPDACDNETLGTEESRPPHIDTTLD